MKGRDILVLVLALALAASLLVAFRYAQPDSKPAPPVLAGRELPQDAPILELEGHYDVSAYLETSHPVFYRNVRVQGMARPAAISTFGSYNSSRGEWLVFEQADGRRVYLPANAVNVLEQSSPEAQP